MVKNLQENPPFTQGGFLKSIHPKICSPHQPIRIVSFFYKIRCERDASSLAKNKSDLDGLVGNTETFPLKPHEVNSWSSSRTPAAQCASRRRGLECLFNDGGVPRIPAEIKSRLGRDYYYSAARVASTAATKSARDIRRSRGDPAIPAWPPANSPQRLCTISRAFLPVGVSAKLTVTAPVVVV